MKLKPEIVEKILSDSDIAEKTTGGRLRLRRAFRVQFRTRNDEQNNDRKISPLEESEAFIGHLKELAEAMWNKNGKGQKAARKNIRTMMENYREGQALDDVCNFIEMTIRLNVTREKENEKKTASRQDRNTRRIVLLSGLSLAGLVALASTRPDKLLSAYWDEPPILIPLAKEEPGSLYLNHLKNYVRDLVLDQRGNIANLRKMTQYNSDEIDGRKFSEDELKARGVDFKLSGKEPGWWMIGKKDDKEDLIFSVQKYFGPLISMWEEVPAEQRPNDCAVHWYTKQAAIEAAGPIIDWLLSVKDNIFIMGFIKQEQPWTHEYLQRVVTNVAMNSVEQVLNVPSPTIENLKDEEMALLNFIPPAQLEKFRVPCLDKRNRIIINFADEKNPDIQKLKEEMERYRPMLEERKREEQRKKLNASANTGQVR